LRGGERVRSFRDQLLFGLEWWCEMMEWSEEKKKNGFFFCWFCLIWCLIQRLCTRLCDDRQRIGVKSKKGLRVSEKSLKPLSKAQRQ